MDEQQNTQQGQPVQQPPQMPQPPKSKSGLWVAIIVVVILVIVGAWYANSHKQSSQTQTQTQSSSSQQSAAANEKVFTVQGQNFSFTPSTITVNKGDKVKITFQNTGGTHDFVIDEFGVKTSPIGDGQSTTVEFTADKSGTFQYYCSVDHHRDMGMVGTLTVQ